MLEKVLFSSLKTKYDGLLRSLPRSGSFANLVKITEDGYLSRYNFYSLKDNPKSGAIMYATNNNLESWELPSYGVFCEPQESEELIEAVNTAPFIDWHKPLVFRYVSEFLAEDLMGIARNKGKKKFSVETKYFYSMTLRPYQLKCPSGLDICFLGETGIKKLYNNYYFKKEVSYNTVHHLATVFPAIGAYINEDSAERVLDINSISKAHDLKEPVAWIMGMNHCGFPGSGQTDPEHRRKGYIETIGLTCMQLVLQKNLFIASIVDKSNEGPKKLMAKSDWSICETVCNIYA